MQVDCRRRRRLPRNFTKPKWKWRERIEYILIVEWVLWGRTHRGSVYSVWREWSSVITPTDPPPLHIAAVNPTIHPTYVLEPLGRLPLGLPRPPALPTTPPTLVYILTNIIDPLPPTLQQIHHYCLWSLGSTLLFHSRPTHPSTHSLTTQPH